MSSLACLPMYDWPETHRQVDGFYARLRALVPNLPATLSRPASETALALLWRNPALVLAQTCWGPMQAGLDRYVRVLAQPQYDGIEGGCGTEYRSALVMRAGSRCTAPPTSSAMIPDGLKALRVAINSPQSLSGCLALQQDAGLTDLAQHAHVTGSHRNSIRAVANGRADLAAIDCCSWAIARNHEPAAYGLVVVGWTALRPGLPYITARATPPPLRRDLARALAELAAQPQHDPEEIS